MKVAHFRILHQKTLLDLSNLLPHSSAALKSVKGMGKKKIQDFGVKLLEIITSYCEMENIALPAAHPERSLKKEV